jgi:hypothetical protein
MKNFILTLFISALSALSAFSQIIWDAPTNVATASTGNNHPRLATDAAGNPMLVWYHLNRVMYSRFDGTSFETPRAINPVSITVAGASWMGPQIATHGDTVYVVFKQTPEDHGKSWAIHSYDGGRTFSDAVQIEFIGDSISRFPTVTVDEEGHPIVAFMKFNSTFGEAQWAVSRSYDFGNSFGPDVLASGWSSATANVCDCCPGSIVSSGENVVMLYRDNDSNKRDSWAGLSKDGGETFIEGTNIDQQNWMISSCPASGPDGVIIGDTLYSTFMNGASGKTLAYFNRTSLTDFVSGPSMPVTDLFFGLASQNFPRIASSGNALAVAWKQIVAGQEQLVLNFYSDITSGLAPLYDTVDFNQIMNVDIAMTDTKIYVAWEDYNSGTIRFRTGTYEDRTAVDDGSIARDLSVYPNPSGNKWYLKRNDFSSTLKVELYDVRGQLMNVDLVRDNSNDIEIDNSMLHSGLYFLRLVDNHQHYSMILVKQ